MDLQTILDYAPIVGVILLALDRFGIIKLSQTPSTPAPPTPSTPDADRPILDALTKVVNLLTRLPMFTEVKDTDARETK